MRPLFSAGIARVVFGLVAVWCLGCRSLDVFLERMLEDCGETPMLVATESGVVAQYDAQEPHSEVEPLNDCGCFHCVAVKTPIMAPAVAPDLPPLSFDVKPHMPTSVVREPLVPPPIGHVAA